MRTCTAWLYRSQEGDGSSSRPMSAAKSLLSRGLGKGVSGAASRLAQEGAADDATRWD